MIVAMISENNETWFDTTNKALLMDTNAPLPKYIVVHEASLHILEDTVNRMIELGYMPIGAFRTYPWTANTIRYAQTMILKEVQSNAVQSR